MIRLLLTTFFALTLAWSHVSAQSPSRPVTSKYLVTEGGGFLTGPEGVAYGLTFSARDTLLVPAFATVIFQNPEDSKKPFTTQITIKPGQRDFMAQSPVFPRIANGKRYKVEVLLYSDEARTERLGKHVQKVLFYLPEEMAGKMGVELL